MTDIHNKKTGKYETITIPEDMPIIIWAEASAGMNFGKKVAQKNKEY